MKREDMVLMAGCGNSRLTEDMFEDGYTTITNIDLFFTLTAIGLMFAFITAMTSLLYQPKEWKSGQNIKTILGLITAFIILGISIQRLIEGIITLLS